ncbi:hypothetical protein C8R46DRAFT_1252183 [Mycena filopes]|nr:hypothetical protein C8R46DRAFT_1252183 [Mycena filopes]
MKNSIICIILVSFIVDSYALPPPLPAVDINPTQYHATCAKYAPSIKRAVDSKTLVLGPGRRWPDEFTWSGGFYITPDQANAEAYGASFMTDCLSKSLGGVVIIEFRFDPSALSLTTAADDVCDSVRFHKQQDVLGEKIWQYVVENSASLPPPPPPPPATDDNPMSQVEGKGPPPATPEQISVIRKDTSSSSVPSDLWPLYDDFEQYDVIVGAVKMNPGQQKCMDAAVSLGMPPIQDPFIQVVLVTDAGKQLSYVTVEALKSDLTRKQPAVEQALANLSPPSSPVERRGFGFRPW